MNGTKEYTSFLLDLIDNKRYKEYYVAWDMLELCTDIKTCFEVANRLEFEMTARMNNLLNGIRKKQEFYKHHLE